jgi:hypothetical protein
MPSAGRDGGRSAASDPPADPGMGEFLDTGLRPWDRRRRVVALAIGLVAVTAIAVPAVQHRRAAHRFAAPSPSPSLSLPVVPAPARQVGAPPALLIGSTLYMVRDGRLVARPSGAGMTSSAGVGDPALTGASYLLAADPSRSRMWVVQSVPARILIYAFDLVTLHEVRRLHIEGEVAGADVLRGGLYISTDVGVVGITGARSGLLDWTPLRGGRAIVADRSRGRLLLLDEDGASARVRAESPDLAGPSSSATLPFVTGGLVIVAGQIWAGGAGPDGAVLVRLDPRTLRPVAHSPVEEELGSAAVFAAAGQHSFLVRSTHGGAEMWCVDAVTGAVRQNWPDVPGPAVISTRAGSKAIYTIPSGTGLRRLAPGGCPG